MPLNRFIYTWRERIHSFVQQIGRSRSIEIIQAVLYPADIRTLERFFLALHRSMSSGHMDSRTRAHFSVRMMSLVTVRSLDITTDVNGQIFGGSTRFHARSLGTAPVRLYFIACSTFHHSKAMSLMFTRISKDNPILYYRSVLCSRWVRVYVRIHPCRQPQILRFPSSKMPMSCDLTHIIW